MAHWGVAETKKSPVGRAKAEREGNIRESRKRAGAQQGKQAQQAKQDNELCNKIQKML